MALYVGKVKYAVTKTRFRGFWAVVIHGFAGTTVTCGTSTRHIGSNESCTFRLTDAGVYTFVATRNGQTKTKVVEINDNTGYIVEFGLYIGMQQLEYIESTGTQYIDTGIVPTINTKIVAKASRGVASVSNPILGCRDGSYQNCFVAGFASDNSLNVDFKNSNTLNYRATYTAGTTVNKKLILTVSKDVRRISDERDITLAQNTVTLADSFSATKSIALFKINGPDDNCLTGRIYSAQIYNNGTLVRDFVPIRDDTGHGALYDKVTQQIFYNSGAGEFVAGPELVELEYIESTGTQYIDTGVVPHEGYSADLIFQFRDITSPQYPSNQICGVRQDDLPSRFYPIAVATTSSLRTCYGNTQVVYSVDPLSKHTVNMNKNGHIYLDDTDYGSCAGSYVEPLNPQYNMYLFKWNPGSTTSSVVVPCKMRIYGYKMYDNTGTLIRDLIPVRIGTEVGMYDLVTETFFTNAGTGNFIAGPEKE